jgi:type IV pilus assembly protein PilW
MDTKTPMPRPISGFSLIEMMISITIGLVVVSALVGVLASNARNSKTNDRTSELQSNGRYAMDHLSSEIRQAGFHAYTPLNNPITSSAITISGALPACGGSTAFVSNIRQGIWGINDNNSFSGDCIPANYLRGDVLVIRHMADQSTLSASGVPNTVYLRSSYDSGNVFQFTTAAAVPVITGDAAAENFELWISVYYIGSDDADATLPALRRVRLQTGSDPTPGSMLDEMVVSGIEHLQVQYGVFNSIDNTTQYFDANSISGSSATTGATGWDNVHAVRIWLLSRNAKAEANYANTNTYRMGSLDYGPMNDSIRRQLFATVVKLRN